MNKVSILSLITGILLIIFVQFLEMKSIVVLFQPKAIIIVLGGTLCATFLNFPKNTILNAVKISCEIFKKQTNDSNKIINEILQIAYFARKNGLLALNDVLDELEDPFLKRSIKLAIDLNDPQLFNEIMQSQIDYDEEQELISSRVFEAMGGYAPTFGIIGAVLGLIQVMSYINEPTLLANGISTAFIATLYGVGLANIIFLPIAGSLKLNLRDKILLKEIIVQGLISVQTGENPAIIEEKLVSYIKFSDLNQNIKNYSRSD